MTVGTEVNQRDARCRCHKNSFFWPVDALLMKRATDALKNYFAALKFLTQAESQCHIAVVHMKTEVPVRTWPIVGEKSVAIR